MNSLIRKRNRLAAVGVVLMVGLVAAPAQAGLGRKLVRNITLGLSPSIGTIQNGPNFNENDLSQRFNVDPLTEGRSYEVQRFFGDDSFGNPETLNLGLLNVELGPPDGSPLRGAGFYSRVGYNKRIVPEVYWDFRTTGRNVSTFIGTSSAPAPLQYNIDMNNGLDAARLNGQILINSSGSVNVLGFYDVDLTVSNSGTLSTDGLLTDRDQELNFDIGPIKLRGNVAVDTALAVLDFVGEQLGVPEEEFSVLGLRERTSDEIVRAIESGQAISAADFNALVAALIENPDAVDLPASALPAPAGSTQSLQATVPEPGTAVLLIIAATLGLTRRRRRR